MKTWPVTIVLLAACGPDTICERTGQCVEITGAGTPVHTTPSLDPAEQFRTPVDTPLMISSTFGPRWKYSQSREEFHLGIDYYGTLGQPLYAIGTGTVFGVYPDGGDVFPNGGNVVVIEHAIPPRTFHQRTVDKVYAVYLHTQTILVAEGDDVTAGEKIATMGMTGNTDFLHLHFETRVQTTCSLPYQLAHPTFDCVTGFDPHVHPFLFVGGQNENQISVEHIEGDGFVVRYTATRGDLDLDVIDTDLGTVDFDTREGIDAKTVKSLDDFDYGFVRVVPLEFLSSSDALVYELHFRDHPAYLELRDIYGDGIRFGDRVP